MTNEEKRRKEKDKARKQLDTERLNAVLADVLAGMNPPDNLTASEWAAKKRQLSPEASAEPGPWRNSRTPYLQEPMDAFNDPKVQRIVMVAASQVGKSELELNIIGYIIDEDPSSNLGSSSSADPWNFSDSRGFATSGIKVFPYFFPYWTETRLMKSSIRAALACFI